MKIEVMVDKDNTHFSYMFDCDKVKDGSHDGVMRPQDDNGKLVIMKNVRDIDRTSGKPMVIPKIGANDTEMVPTYKLETIAVFNVWTFWRKIPDKAVRCGYCGRFEVMDKNNKCPKCGKPQLVGN